MIVSAPHTDPSEITNTLTLWCEEVSTSFSNGQTTNDVTWEYYIDPLKKHYTTSIVIIPLVIHIDTCTYIQLVFKRFR